MFGFPTAQDGPRGLLDSSKTAQEGSKRPSWRARRSQTVFFFVFRCLMVFEILACLGFRPPKAAQEASLGRLGALLERFRAVLGPYWEPIGRSLGHLGPTWGRLGLSWSHIGGLLGRLGRSETQIGEDLKIFQTPKGRQRFGPPRALQEGLWEPHWAVLGAS